MGGKRSYELSDDVDIEIGENQQTHLSVLFDLWIFLNNYRWHIRDERRRP